MRRALTTLCAILLAAACQRDVCIDDEFCSRPQAPVTLTVKADGSILWNGIRIDEPELNARLAQASRPNPQPYFDLSPDRDAKPGSMGVVIAAIERAGLTDKAGVLGGTQ